MARVHPELTGEMIEWIGHQPVFFVGTAASDGSVNVSPKGYDAFRVIDPLRVAYMDLTGSGAETVAHLRAVDRITVMFCAFSGKPRILRLYGTARYLSDSSDQGDLGTHFPILPGQRAIVDISVHRVQTSCGFGVPLMEVLAERPTLIEWAERKGPDRLVAYRAEKNAVSIDGFSALDIGDGAEQQRPGAVESPDVPGRRPLA